MRRPAFQFYPADWRKDIELQACSIGARGLWHEMLCVMHECRPYGHLAVNGVGATDAQAANMLHVPLPQYRSLLKELETAGVPSRTSSGILYSRRMVKDERFRAMRAEFGKLGGNPALLPKEDKVKDNPEDNLPTDEKDNTPVNTPPKVELTPSSSSSTSVIKALTNKKNGEERRAVKPLPPKWWTSDQGILAAALASGVKPLPGQDYEALKNRIFEHEKRQREAS